MSFISTDKKHDHEQIEKSEQQLFEIIREKVRPGKKNSACFSHSCSAKFKSGHCAANLFNNIGILKLTQVSFHYFESHKGKNSIDSIGSTNKCHFRHAILKIVLNSTYLNSTACTLDMV